MHHQKCSTFRSPAHSIDFSIGGFVDASKSGLSHLKPEKWRLSRNGQQTESREPIKRVRFDNLPSIGIRTDKRSNAGVFTESRNLMPPGHSGRRFVIALCCAVLLIWGVLYLSFREWRARYRVRAAYGMAQVVPVIDRLEEITPPNLDPVAWRDAVRRTHDLLATVTASNLLDQPAMDKLRGELDRAVARVRTHPAGGIDELAAIWNELADRGEFLLRDSRSAEGVRHPRPKILPPRPQKTRVPSDRASDRISKTGS